MAAEFLGSYRLISRLGAGGMGEVWRAEDTRLLRPVAIKILSEKIANDPEWKARFLREARTVAQMNHPNIATIYSIEQEGDTLFIAMELVEGESLAAVLARGPLPPKEAVRIVGRVAEALAEAHEKGVVHRDVKPDNIIVAKRTVKVLDFGIAKQTNPGSMDSRTLTQGGMIVGTPYYMSPEQALGRAVDARSDIFSLGVVMYEAIAGKRPFDGESITETMMNIIMHEPTDIAALCPTAPKEIADVVRLALQKKPEGRYSSAGEMIDALSRISFEPRPVTPPPPRKSDAPTVAIHPAVAPKSAPVPAAVPPSRLSPATHTPAPPAMPATPPPATARPAGPAPQQQPRPVPAPAPTPAPPPPEMMELLAGQRALIADDDPVARYLLGTVLTQNRIAFDEATNGADAVKALKAREYTLLFLDLLMPRVDGWGVIDYFRRVKSPKMPRVFIITGVRDQTLSAADRDVVTGLLNKPLDPAEVARVIQKALAEVAGA